MASDVPSTLGFELISRSVTVDWLMNRTSREVNGANVPLADVIDCRHDTRFHPHAQDLSAAIDHSDDRIVA